MDKELIDRLTKSLPEDLRKKIKSGAESSDVCNFLTVLKDLHEKLGACIERMESFDTSRNIGKGRIEGDSGKEPEKDTKKIVDTENS